MSTYSEEDVESECESTTMPFDIDKYIDPEKLVTRIEVSVQLSL